MIARLFLLLALIGFAQVPVAAMPACHDGSGGGAAAAHGAMRHEAPATPAPGKATPAHVCVGCVPVGDWLGVRIAPRPVHRAPLAPMAAPRLDLGRASPPALPPPRVA